MIIVQGNVDDITITPANPEADPPTVETAMLHVQIDPPGAGVCSLVIQNAAMGGIAIGPCRVMIESA